MVTQCAIMPPIAAVFTVKEHTLLRIIIYLFQFLLCSIQVILAYRHLWNRLRWQHSIIDLTTIRRICDSHYLLSNPPSMQHNNINNGLYLPNQPHLWCPIIQHPRLPRHPPPGNHWFPPLPIAHLVHCHHIPTAKHLHCQPKGTSNDHRVPQGRVCLHQDAQTTPWDGRQQCCRAPLVFQGLASQQQCQLGRSQLGTSAAMGTTTAATRWMTFQLTHLRPAVIAELPITLMPTRAVMMTMKHQTSWTYMVKKSTITLINIQHGIQIWRGASVTITVQTPTLCKPD